ncbi:MAG: hypothetical protein JW827_06250 [Spirochaetes bacterium]|nr:hypothetical protein [Spirochaetota bacterium]
MGKKKTIVILLTHGNLAQSLIETAKMIMGEMNDIVSINFPKEMNVLKLENRLDKLINKNKGNNIIIFIDMFGGSCLNVCCKYLSDSRIRIFSGINLPILLETMTTKDYLPFPQLIDKIKKKLSSAMLDVNEKTNTCEINK